MVEDTSLGSIGACSSMCGEWWFKLGTSTQYSIGLNTATFNWSKITNTNNC